MRLSRRGVLAALPLAVLAGPAPAFQTEPLTAGRLLREQGRYLPRWIELLDEPGERARVLTMLGPDQAQAVDWVLRDGVTQYASFLGDEATALRDASRSVTTPDPEADLIAGDALAAIVEASRGHRVVMLNEAHVASRHRAFLGRLVVALRAEGFTHLAAETFADAQARAELPAAERVLAELRQLLAAACKLTGPAPVRRAELRQQTDALITADPGTMFPSLRRTDEGRALVADLRKLFDALVHTLDRKISAPASPEVRR